MLKLIPLIKKLISTLIFKKDTNQSLPPNKISDQDLSKDPILLYNQGYAHLTNNEWQCAANCFLRLIALTPDDAECFSNLGLALKELGRYEEAKKYLSTALSLDKDLAYAHYILGLIAQESRDSDQALIHFNNAIKVKPDFGEAYGFLGLHYSKIGMMKESVEFYKKSLALNPSLFNTHSALLLTLQYMSETNREELFRLHIEFAEKFETTLKPLLYKHQNDKNPSRKLKIGYVSGDFRKHSVALFMLPIFANYNRQNFQVFCYYNNTYSDEVSAEISGLVDHFSVCIEMSDEELAEKIKNDGIDILIDLSGHTAETRLLTFSRKPAPIQVTYLGYIDTTGLSGIDYRITNLDADPIGNDKYYSEKLYRFKNLWWCYRPAPNLPAITALPALTNGFISFVSANHIAKISDDTIYIWSSILNSLPDSKLIFMGVPQGLGRNILLKKFNDYGITKERLTFHDWSALDIYREKVMEADIALDTFPYNGGTTTCEILCLGLPLITLMGDTFVSRMGYALMKSIGLQELVANNGSEYVKNAIQLANDKKHLTTLRGTMRARLLQSPLCDEVAFTKDLEKAYCEMWEKYCTFNQQ